MNIEKAYGWDNAPLEELLEFYIGGDWGKDPEFVDDAMELAYCIRGSEIRNWNENKGNTASLRKIKKTNIAKRKLIVDDILVEISGGGPEQPVGRTILIDKTALSFEPSVPKICTNFLRLIRPKDSINSKFLDLYLKFFYNSGEIIKYQNGSNNLRNLIFPEFLKIEIPFPLPDEQLQIVEKIEELFSELDKGIENLKNAQQQLKVYRQAVLKWAFEGKLTNENVKDGELPEGWEWKKISDVANVGTGGTPLKSNPKFYDNGNIAWVTSGALNDNYVTEATDYITTEALKQTNCKIYPKHTLLLAMYGEGKTRGMCSELMIEACTNQAIAAIHFDGFDTSVKPYLKYFLLKNYNDIRRKSSGGVQPNINLGIVKNLKFPLAPKIEQSKIINEIESRLSVCDKMEETISTGLQQAEVLRQSILKRAFEGKWVKAETKVVNLDVLIKAEYEKDWQRKVLAGKIIQICYKDNNFGHTKFQKTLQVCEYHAQLEFNSHYVKDVAGPFDKDFFFPFIEEGRVNDWFSEKRKQVAVFFKPGGNIKKLVQDYDNYFKPVDDKIQFVTNLLKDKTTFESELISTIYAIWNNFLIDGLYISDNQLITEVYEWSESKIKFSESDIIGMWQWMNDAKLIPVGFGKLINEVG